MDQVLSELKSKGLVFRPHFWISTEWFCPDGIGGVAVPFFLLHPRLQRLERDLIGEVDGGRRVQALKILRHEVGHALDNAFRLHRERERQEVFGPSDLPYPESYSPKPYSRHFVSHLQPGYAQSHPLEDFAETFAVWLDPHSRWRQRYNGQPAFKKLLYLDQRMRALRGQRPQLRTRRSYEPLHRLKQSLRDHYLQRQRHLGLGRRGSPWEQRLREILARARGGRWSERASAEKLLLRLEPDARRQVAQAIGEPQYRISQVIRELRFYARHWDQSQGVLGRSPVPPVSASLRRDFLDLVTERSLEHLKRGPYRVML